MPSFAMASAMAGLAPGMKTTVSPQRGDCKIACFVLENFLGYPVQFDYNKAFLGIHERSGVESPGD
jgi:hypothetical protein